MSEGEGDSFAALQTRIAAYPKSTRGVYYEVANFVPKLAPWRQEQILAEHEGYPPSAQESTYKTAMRWHREFKKFKRAKGKQRAAQEEWLRIPVTRLETTAAPTPSTTPLPVTGVKHSRPPSSPTTSNANGVHNRVTPNKAPHKKASAGRGVALTDSVRKQLDPPTLRRTSPLDLEMRQKNKLLLDQIKEQLGVIKTQQLKMAAMEKERVAVVKEAEGQCVCVHVRVSMRSILSLLITDNSPPRNLGVIFP
jgi:hypothetical protein